MVGALFLALSLSFGGCHDWLAPRAARMFSEYSIAKTIEQLGPKDGAVFAHMLHGITYDRIAKRFRVTVEEVKAIAHSGHALLMYYKDLGV